MCGVEIWNIDLQDFSGRVKGFKVEAVDTTGAGDAFVAGILSQLALDLSLLQVLITRTSSLTILLRLPFLKP